ncbi:MAG: bi-domain-containing oxidoreductase [Actinobacteria bacterium]|nr:bi-domain-containing oxidoreductase [Actinomycetota bacterium]
MKQVFRRVIDRRGRVLVADLPVPHVGPDQVLVQSHYSLISSGTEMGTLSKTPAELVRQTVSDPWMRQVVKQTILATGPSQTARRVWHEMITPREIGYSGAGTVLALGDHVEGLEIGQTVAYAATGHAEVTAPYINHVVPVPGGMDLRHAAFVTVGGIAMQSLRRADVKFGETVAIYGLGLVGQLCASIAKAAGCVVVGIDINPKANELATAAGAALVVNPSEPGWKRRIGDFTGKNGVDATVICASSDSPEIVNAAMEITRRQGRVVLVGYVKLDIHPKAFLYREIDLRYSRAYGPGSYDTGYEKGRVDYPFGYVRWTEKRNLEEFIRLVSTGAVDPGPLIAGVYPVERAQEPFDAIRERTLPGVAALISYRPDPDRRRTMPVKPRPKRDGKVGISLIGFGNHTLSTHLPNLRAMSDVELRGIASATARNASAVAKNVGATMITTDVDELLADDGTDAVLICSSQPEHYGHIRAAVTAGKAVLTEKPMVTRLEDFRELLRLMDNQPTLVTLGLNRRYSPLVGSLRESLRSPADFVEYVIAQQPLPADHWSLDPVDGGGRLVSEGEHFIDLCNLLIGKRPLSVTARALGKLPDDLRTLCNFAVTLHYDAAAASIMFNESGVPGFPRERVSVFARGQVAILDDFGKLTSYRAGKPRTKGSGLHKSMGHAEELEQFVRAVKGEPNHLLSWEGSSLATLCMFAAQESIRMGAGIDLDQFHRSLLDLDLVGGIDPDAPGDEATDDVDAVVRIS